jgi:hypothetical protein
VSDERQAGGHEAERRQGGDPLGDHEDEREARRQPDAEPRPSRSSSVARAER